MCGDTGHGMKIAIARSILGEYYSKTAGYGGWHRSCPTSILNYTIYSHSNDFKALYPNVITPLPYMSLPIFK